MGASAPHAQRKLSPAHPESVAKLSRKPANARLGAFPTTVFVDRVKAHVLSLVMTVELSSRPVSKERMQRADENNRKELDVKHKRALT
ncbi:MAG: hypothetical protein EBT43_07185 [Methylocystaceae bacterium]|nr:hypothetical protein [Methylocystaceae bacterium]